MPDVHRHRQAELARDADLLLADLHRGRLGTLQRERELHETAGRSAGQLLDLVPSRSFPGPSLELVELPRHRGAVREDGTDRQLDVRADRLLTVLRRVDDVAPVEHRGDAVVQCFGDRGPGRDVHVLRRERDSEVRPNARTQVSQDSVHRDAPERLVPEVPVGVDQAGHDDPARPVDRFGIRVDRGRDGSDDPVLDEDVALTQRSHDRVEAEDRATADEEPSGQVERRSRGGTTGRRMDDGCEPPVWIAASVSMKAGGLSAGSSCRNGPLPDITNHPI